MLARVLLAIAGLSLATTIALIILGRVPAAGIPMLLAFIAPALYGQVNKEYQRISFTFWVFAFLVAAMYYPFLFTDWGFNTKVLVIPMLQLIMFGMGTKLSLADFKTELKKPKGIIVGLIMVFTVMPIVGVMVARAFQFPPEIAVGVILIGACPGGASSNVMAFLAKGNVALSVSVTTIATLLTPIVTPALMKLFANELIEISFIKMMLSSFNLIIMPVAAGLISHHILYSKAQWLKIDRNVIGLGVIFAIACTASVLFDFPSLFATLRPGFILAFGLSAIVSFVKVMVRKMSGPENWMDKILPSLSMVAILLFVTIVVALNRDQLLVVGLLLVAASAIHNFIGYVLGYWGSRLAGLSIQDSRTLSIEVALKNGGLGMGLALDALNNANAALAPIVFGKWMNISGSALANYWRGKSTGEEAVVAT